MLFFSRPFDPVLNGCKGDEDPVIPPQVPGGGPIGQTVFEHHAQSQRDHAVGIVTARWRQVGRIGIEVEAALFASVLGIKHLKGMRPPGARVPQIVQVSLTVAVSVASPTALGTRPAAILAGTNLDRRLGKIFEG
jgi:hypothetical protein